MRHRRSRAQGGREEGGLRDLLPGGPGLLGVLRVDIQAVRALGGARHGEGDQLAILARNAAIIASHDGVELDEALELRGRQLLELSENLEIIGIVIVAHVAFLLGGSFVRVSPARGMSIPKSPNGHLDEIGERP